MLEINQEDCVENLNATDNYENKETSEAINEILAIEMQDGNKVEYVIGHKVIGDNKKRFEEIFYREYVDAVKPEVPSVKKEIRLVLENDKPFYCAPRRLGYSEKSELQKILDEYLAKGYIRPSDSEFVSPIVLVKKKTGDLRMCVDYRKLNKITARDNYPIPLIDDLLDRLVNMKLFTKLDLKNGFFHVYVEEQSVNSPATFE